MPRSMLMISMMLSCFYASSLYAADMPVQSDKALSTVAISSPKTLPPSAIHRFVTADFDGQLALIVHWPDRPESLEKLYTALSNDQLYTDTQGHAYLVLGDGNIVDYDSQQKVNVAPETLTDVSLNNTMRTAFDNYHAQRGLLSTDLPTRKAAAVTLSNDPLDVNDELLDSRLHIEKDSAVLAILTRIKAQKDMESSDAVRQLAGATALASSNDPDVLVLVQTKLANPEISPALKQALTTTAGKIELRLKASEWSGYFFSGLSMASILLLAALGLAITYGLLGVINMAHGELIMIGAYATYVVQNVFIHYFPHALNAYLLVAVPVAFLVSAVIGMAIERIVIRPLYGRQLETLLATFGVSLILMQVVRMIFGAQNVQVANPSWMSGGLIISPSLTLPYSRIVIIAFTIAVVLVVKYLISGTRFGLFVRAVTQNRTMARAIGVRSSRIDMLAFGLGSGLAGLAGCALSQIGNVGPDLGQNYIIDAFLVVVVGGVGQLLGAMLAAFGLGISGKFLEVFMGAVLAKILLLGLIILFIQRRPQGLFAVKGRFVE
jgi:urea transport system permease protein